MKALLTALLAMLVVLGAHYGRAEARSLHGASLVCPYNTDNGCSGSMQYVATPYWQTATFAYDSAQSGQLPVSPSGAQIAVRNASMHADSGNRPYLDYAIGSADPATLAPISTYVDPDGAHPICVYAATGSEYGGGPVLTCQGTNAANAGTTRTISGYDFTNAGGGHGTACVQVTIKNQAGGGSSGVTYVFQNDYWQASGTCFAGTGGAPSALIHAQSAGSSNPPAAINFYNITADGNFAAASTGTLGRVNFLKDDRSGGTTPYNWPKTVLYSLIHDFGHLAFFGGTSGSVTFRYSAFLNNCQSGQSLCHGELVEDTGKPFDWGSTAGGKRAYEATGNIYSVSSSANNNQETTAFYISAGNPANTNYSTVTLRNNLVVWNKTLCGNAGPYSPNNPCSAGQSYGHGFFSIDYTTSVATLDVSNNMFDGTATASAYAVEWNNYGAATPPAASAAGTVMTVTSPATTYNNTTPVLPFWPGYAVHDSTGGSSFIDTVVASLGTYTNTGTLGTPVTNCTIGVNAGCGTLNLADSQPTIASGHTYVTYTGVTTVIGGTNYSFGGAWGAAQKTFDITGRAWASPSITTSTGIVPLP